MVRKLNEDVYNTFEMAKVLKSNLSNIREQLNKIDDELEWFDVEVDDIINGDADVTVDYSIALANLVLDIYTKLNQAERLTRLGPNNLPD